MRGRALLDGRCGAGFGTWAVVALLQQNNMEQKLTRIADRSELGWSIETAKRFKAQTPAPTSEAALRRLVAGLASGSPPFDELVSPLAQIVRDQLPGLREMARSMGDVQSMQFKRTLPSGMDIYQVKGSMGERELGVLVQADGKVFAAQ